MNTFHYANQKYWDATSYDWKVLRDEDAFWKRCHINPQLAFEPKVLELIQEYVEPLSGKSVCVLGSGDNYASFALAGLGADVTSIDISEKQLEIAAERAENIGLEIEFVRADISDMPNVQSNCFDFACATNGVTIWISDLIGYYYEVCRILRPNGHFISCDVHPFQRPWKDRVKKIEMQKPYFDTGPYKSDYLVKDTDATKHKRNHPAQEEKLTGYTFHWTMSDIINSVISSRLTLLRIYEEPSEYSRFWQGPSYATKPDNDLLDWKNNPRAGLPVWLVLVAQKLKQDL